MDELAKKVVRVLKAGLSEEELNELMSDIDRGDHLPYVDALRARDAVSGGEGAPELAMTDGPSETRVGPDPRTQEAQRMAIQNLEDVDEDLD